MDNKNYNSNSNSNSPVYAKYSQASIRPIFYSLFLPSWTGFALASANVFFCIVNPLIPTLNHGGASTISKINNSGKSSQCIPCKYASIFPFPSTSTRALVKIPWCASKVHHTLFQLTVVVSCPTQTRNLRSKDASGKDMHHQQHISWHPRPQHSSNKTIFCNPNGSS